MRSLGLRVPDVKEERNAEKDKLTGISLLLVLLLSSRFCATDDVIDLRIG